MYHKWSNKCLLSNKCPVPNQRPLWGVKFVLDALCLIVNVKEQPRYQLRSASGLKLKYPSLKLKKTLGDRAFSSAAPNLWNNLPLHIHLVDNFERFKTLLKTHLFKLAFDM